MKAPKSIAILMLVVCLLLHFRGSESQYCLNAAGEPVSWWVILKVPPMINNSGYGYYDSNMKSG